MKSFLFNSEVIRLNQLICDLHSLVTQLGNNSGEKLNGELKTISQIAEKAGKIKKDIELVNERIPQ